MSDQRFTTIIFDFDDTLCLTEEATFHIENEAASRLGFGPMPRSLHQQTWGQLFSEVCTVRFPGIPKAKFLEMANQVLQEWIQEEKVDTLSAERLAFLDALRESGYQLGVLTSRELSECAHMLGEEHPLQSRMDYFQYRERSPFVKPDPRVFQHILNELGTQPEQVLYVGDSPSDAAASNGAGVGFVATLEGGIRTPADFAEYDVIEFLPKLEELSKLLGVER